jgi:hypothetical protein
VLAALELLDQRLAIDGRSREHGVRRVAAREVLADELEHGGELREHQDTLLARAGVVEHLVQ